MYINKVVIDKTFPNHYSRIIHANQMEGMKTNLMPYGRKRRNFGGHKFSEIAKKTALED